MPALKGKPKSKQSVEIEEGFLTPQTAFEMTKGFDRADMGHSGAAPLRRKSKNERFATTLLTSCFSGGGRWREGGRGCSLCYPVVRTRVRLGRNATVSALGKRCRSWGTSAGAGSKRGKLP